MANTQRKTRPGRSELSATTLWITSLALQQPDGLVRAISDREACSLSKSRRIVRQLVDLGWLRRQGTLQRPHYSPGLMRQVVQRYLLSGLQEDLPWQRDFAPCFDLSPSVFEMAQHAFTELLNNAVDHSGGSQVTMSMRQTASHLQMLVCDDGRGLFDKIREGFDIEDPATAVLELSKGRLTSCPAQHSGRGLFFTLRLADIFDLHANAVAYQHREWAASKWVQGKAVRQRGSAIYLAIALDTPRTLDQVLRSASLDGESYRIERASLPLRLLTGDRIGLESRAQARRVSARLASLQEADLDFSGVDRIGQGFADELFRVFARDQGSLKLSVHNASQKVAAMISAVQRA